MTIVLQIFPNGEFTQGVDTSASRHKKHPPKQNKYSSISAVTKEQCRDAITENAEMLSRPLVEGDTFVNQHGGKYIYLSTDLDGEHFAYEDGTCVLEDVTFGCPVGRLVARGELRPLVYQVVEFSPRPSRKQSLSMSSSMKRNIRNAVFMLEYKYKKECLSFLTLTLPALSQSDLAKCCQEWGRMTDNFLKYLSRALRGSGIEPEYVYCTEIQSKRLHTRGEYAPHLHIVYRGKQTVRSPWATTPRDVRKAWGKIISSVLSHSEFSTASLENLQRIKYSASRYLSKYISKSSNCLPKSDGSSAVTRLRTHWGGMARSLARLLRSSINRFTSANGDIAIQFVRRIPDLLKNRILIYAKTQIIPLKRCETTGMERGLFVSSGCLRVPAFFGGIVLLCQFLLE